MILCIPYGFQIKKNLSREANLALHQLHVLENNDQSILTTILEDDLYEATKLQTEYH